METQAVLLGDDGFDIKNPQEAVITAPCFVGQFPISLVWELNVKPLTITTSLPFTLKVL